MSEDRLNTSHHDQLLSQEIQSTHATPSIVGPIDLKQDNLSFDERVALFYLLAKSPLFTNTPICNNDLSSWFPECTEPSSTSTNYAICKEKIARSLESVLAESLYQRYDTPL